MVLEKGSFGQMPIVQPPKMGSFGQYTHHGIKMDENFIKDIRLVHAALQSLEDIDKQLVLELYKNKEKLSVIGNTYGYSVSGVKYRIGVAIKKICAMLNGDVQQIP